MNEIGYNTEYQKLQLRYAALRESFANQVEGYDHYVTVIGPQLKGKYMVMIGQFEFRGFELTVEIKRLQRMLTLRQSALNKGEKPDAAAITRQVDQEMQKYMRTVRKNIELINDAVKEMEAERLSESESLELRTMYLDAVKHLHPDANLGLPQSAVNLWIHIQAAYEMKQWDAFRFLCATVDGVVSGEKTFDASTDGMEALKNAVAALEKRCAELQKRQRELVSKPPFIYQEMLDDPEEVKLRQGELFDKIASLEETLGKYKEAWNNG